MTTAPVMSVKDELIAELERDALMCDPDDSMFMDKVVMRALLSELADLKRDAERYRHYRKGMVYPEVFDDGIDQSMQAAK